MKFILASLTSLALLAGQFISGDTLTGVSPAGVPATTANIWVDTDGGTCVDNPSPVVYDTATACGTIAAGVNAAEAGDVVRVRPGSYAATTDVTVNGASGNTITLVADGAVTACRFTFSTQSYVRVIGFIVDPSICSQTSAIHTTGVSTGLEFWNITVNNARGNVTGTFSSQADRCNSCIYLGLFIDGNNDGMTETLGSAFHNLGDDSVYAYNHSDNIAVGSGATIPNGARSRWLNTVCEGMTDLGGAAHPDCFYVGSWSSSSPGFTNNLLESWVTIGSPSLVHAKWHHQQQEFTDIWADNVYRLFTTYQLGGAQASIYNNAGVSGRNFRTRFYHNTTVLAVRASSGSDGALQLNDSGGGSNVSASVHNSIFYEAWGSAVTTNICVFCGNSSAYWTKDYNLAYDPDGSVTFTTNWTGQANEQTNVNPVFVNAASDWTLQSSSGARGVGGPLTTTSGSGTGTTFNVATDGGEFFVGSNAANLPQYGGALVPGDTITVGTDVVVVESVSTDAITVTSSFTWADSENVYFGNDTTPDIGAYPYKAGGYALSATYSCSSGTCTVTPNDADLVRWVICYEDSVPYTVDNASPFMCSDPAGTFEARVYPRYASQTLWAVATP
jgi:hypothetical protein